mmetsp:Transcript_6463/g.11195  ORF Transcript_6463/g.11195 Transcript_6463/m.11195 type:complete len:786 (+) Transcript_6463:4776-7133(+)
MAELDISEFIEGHPSTPEAQFGQKVDPESGEANLNVEDKPEGFPIRLFRTRLCGCAVIAFNPVATIFSLLVLIGLIVYCAQTGLEGSKDLINFVFYGTETSSALAAQLCWLYMGSVACWLLFMVYLVVCHGKVKLGDCDPEYSDATYFCLIFTAGAAMGIYFYGVGEGMGNQLASYSGHRFSKNPFLTQDQKDMAAMDLSMFDWGVNTFAPYALVGVLIAYQHFVKGLPMTSRSLFYEFLGDYTWGWIGDLIDGYSIISVMSGLMASLGISVSSVMSGLTALDWLAEDQDDNKNIQMILVAVIIACATVSVATGINVGIKHLATLAMLGSTSLWIVVFMLENKPYILNLMEQEVGSYVSNVFQFSFFTDAFALLKIGEGRAIDQNETASSAWITYFPIYYFSWSMSWAPFVGTFYAKVSKGRTIRECISYTLLVSFVYYLMWFSLFSGGGIRMQRRAWELQNLGKLVHNDTNYFQNSDRPHCYDPPLEPVLYTTLDNQTFTYRNLEPNIGPVCTLSSPISNTWFDYLFQFKDLGYGLAVVSVICMFFFFVTTSDSTSLIFDYLSTNGDENHTRIQRCFWSIMQAVLTILLIYIGDADSALKSAQGICILASIPNVIFLSIGCMNLVYSLNRDKHGGKEGFRMPWFGGVLDIFETIFSLGTHVEGRGSAGPPSGEMVKTFFLSLFAPGLQIFNIYEKSSKTNRYALAIMTTLLWCLSIGFLFWQPSLAFLAYFWFTMIVTATRNTCRAEFNLQGNAAEDVFASFVLYPQVLCQVVYQRNSEMKKFA